MTRGRLWDDVTFGPAGRRRRMRRQLRELDRWYAAQQHRGSRRESRRRFFVTATTSVVAVLATLAVLHQYGVALGVDGIGRRVGLGPAAAVEGSGSFAFMATQPGRPGVPVAYDPCQPIHVVVNDDLGPHIADELLDSALAEVGEATGLTLVRDGATDELPSANRPLRDPARYGDRWSPVLVAWTTPKVTPGLAGDVVGLGGSTRVSDPVSGKLRYVTGTVSLDAPAMRRMLTRGDGPLQARAVLMHELGHVVGLGHVRDRRELMSERNAGRTTFGRGDRQGLAVLGRVACGR